MHTFEPTPLQNDVLVVLDPQTRMHLVDIARRAGITVGAARSRLTYLELKGCVMAKPVRESKPWDRNWWVLTDQGRARLLASEVAA